MKEKLLEQIKLVENGIDPTIDLIHQQRELETIIFLTGFHSLMKTLKEINLSEFKENLFLMLDLTVGDFNTYITPELFYRNSDGSVEFRTDSQEKNSFVSKYSLELHRGVTYLEAPNSANFSKDIRTSGILVDLSSIDDINDLPNKLLSDKNKRIYETVSLDLNLSNKISDTLRKIKL